MLLQHDVTVDVKVVAGPVAVTGASVYLASAGVVRVLRLPGGVSGFGLGAGKSRTFKFVLVGERAGTASLKASVTGTAGGWRCRTTRP